MKMSPKLILFAFISVICSWDYAIGGPTIKPVSDFNAEDRSNTIYKAVKGMGTSESKINEALCTIPYSQRDEVAKAFSRDHKQSLTERLQKETSGQLKKIYRRLMEPRGEILARDMYDYITGKRKDRYGGIIEMLCATNAEEKAEMNGFYKSIYNMEVIKHINSSWKKKDTLLKVLDQQCFRTYCYDKTMTDRKVLKTAQDLQAIDSKTNQAAFMAALEGLYGNKNICIPDFQRVFVQYRSLCNKGIDDAVKEALKGENDDVSLAWQTLVRSTENRSAYYADTIQLALNGTGTDEDRIYRITLQTCEYDLGDINNAYVKIYKESIFDRIKSDFSGDTEDCLKMLLAA